MLFEMHVDESDEYLVGLDVESRPTTSLNDGSATRDQLEKKGWVMTILIGN
jgi:hypothetical protein